MSSAIPETKYAKSGDVHIAYQVVGDGPFDLVFMPTFASHVEFIWEEPSYTRFLQRLASFSRLILLDKRGTGLSDRVTDAATLEERMDDVRAVLDAVGSQHAALLGASDGGSLAALFAATYPERTRALVLYAVVAAAASHDEHPWAATPEQMAMALEAMEGWGGRDFALAFLAMEAPSVAADERFQEWWTRFLRLSASPGAALALTRMSMQIDITRVLPTIRVPTLVVQRTGDLMVPLDTTGDGFLAAFDGPARAIRCALAISAAARQLGLDVRAGLHTGECEVRGDDLAGIAVHIGARVANQAGAGEVLASSTVRDLVAGSGLQFADRGVHALKGVPGEWRLYAVEA